MLASSAGAPHGAEGRGRRARSAGKSSPRRRGQGASCLRRREIWAGPEPPRIGGRARPRRTSAAASLFLSQLSVCFSSGATTIRAIGAPGGPSNKVLGAPSNQQAAPHLCSGYLALGSWCRLGMAGRCRWPAPPWRSMRGRWWGGACCCRQARRGGLRGARLHRCCIEEVSKRTEWEKV
jgi:hypothetical protein